MAAHPTRTTINPSSYFSFYHALDSLGLFFCVWLIVSLFMGYTLGISAWTFGIAVVVSAVFLFARNIFFSPRGGRAFIPGAVLKSNEKGAEANIFPLIGIAVVIVLVMGIIFFGVQGGYDLSADATPSVAAEFIGARIPSTYAPYFDVLFFYPLGLPLLVSQLSAIGIPLHQAAWGMGLLGIIFCFFALARWAIRLTGKKEAAYAVGVLFVGMRLPFLDLMVGEYALLFSLGIGLMAAWWAEENTLMGGIGFAGAAIIHPYMGVVLFLFWLIVGKFASLRQRVTRIIGVGGLAAAGFFPVIWNQGIPYFQLAQRGEISASEWALPPISTVSPLPIFLGLIAVGIGILALAHLRNRVWKNPVLLRMGGVVMVGVLGYLTFSFIPNAVFHAKFLELGWMGLLLFASAYLALHIPRAWFFPVMVGLLLLGAGVNFSSGDLQRLANGSKATLREAQFSEWLFQSNAIPNPLRVLFFTPNSGKMAQYAHQIPVVATSANFTLALHSIRTPAVKKILEETRIASTAIKDNCAECVQGIPFDYLVIDTQRTAPLEGKTPYAMQNGYAVYARD